jgi:hypothetical protein
VRANERCHVVGILARRQVLVARVRPVGRIPARIEVTTIT